MGNFLDKKETLESLREAFQELQGIVKNISEDKIGQVKVTNEWTIKDVISHLAAWNWEYANEIDRILADNPTWQNFYSSKEGTDRFNEEGVGKRKKLSVAMVISDWEKSFGCLEKKIDSLSEDEWLYASKSGTWQNQPITVESIFKYSYRNKPHEAGHAEQIKEVLLG